MKILDPLIFNFGLYCAYIDSQYGILVDLRLTRFDEEINTSILCNFMGTQ
jgi:hypothetical protein